MIIRSYRYFTTVELSLFFVLISLPLRVVVANDDAFLDDVLGNNDHGKLISHWTSFVEWMPRRYSANRSSSNAANSQQVIWAEAEADIRIAGDLNAYVRPRLYIDLENTALERLAIPDAYITYQTHSTEFRVGTMVENWGIVDTYNPIDILNPRDLGTDFLNPLKLGQPGIRLRQFFAGNEHFGEPTFSVYWMPFFEPVQYAPSGHRFEPLLADVTFSDGGGVRPRDADKWFWALRYQTTVNAKWANSDMQLITSRGPNRSPSLGFVDGSLGPIYQQVETLGFGVRSVLEQKYVGSFLSSLTLKGEIAHRSFEKYDHSDIQPIQPYWAAVVGLDREFSSFFSPQSTLLLTGEYAFEMGENGEERFTRFFQNDLIVRLLWQSNNFNRSEMELRGVIDLDVDESNLELTYRSRVSRISDDLFVEIGYQHFNSETGSVSPLGTNAQNSSLFASLRWTFGG